MTNGNDLVGHYFLESAKIKEARQIFFDKGVIRRELIANELAFSWLRCKYKNVDSIEEPLHNKGNGVFLPLNNIANCPREMSEIWVGIFDAQGKLLRYSGNATLCQRFSKWNFDEIHAGYNGIGNCLENRVQSVVIGYEHYHEALCDTISIGIPVENGFLGLIIPLKIDPTNQLDALLQLPFETLLATTFVKELKYPLNCHFFRNDIEVFSNCYNAFRSIADQQACLKIMAADPQDAYLLAHAIHKNSIRTQMPFVYISDKLPLNVLEQIIGDQRFIGTLYIEEGTWLTRRLQDLIVRISSSKLINSKAESGLFETDIAIIIYENKTLETQDELQPLYVDLLNQMEKCKLCIPSFQDIGGQFKLYLCSEFEKICEQQDIQGISYNEAVLNLLTQYDWPKGYFEIEMIADYHLSHASNPYYVDMESLPAYLKTSKSMLAMIPSLKEKEREWIAYVLTQHKGNIKQSAKILGITRTTLYKKIEEYQIEV